MAPRVIDVGPDEKIMDETEIRIPPECQPGAAARYGAVHRIEVLGPGKVRGGWYAPADVAGAVQAALDNEAATIREQRKAARRETIARGPGYTYEFAGEDYCPRCAPPGAVKTSSYSQCVACGCYMDPDGLRFPG